MILPAHYSEFLSFWASHQLLYCRRKATFPNVRWLLIREPMILPAQYSEFRLSTVVVFPPCKKMGGMRLTAAEVSDIINLAKIVFWSRSRIEKLYSVHIPIPQSYIVCHEQTNCFSPLLFCKYCCFHHCVGRIAKLAVWWWGRFFCAGAGSLRQ